MKYSEIKTYWNNNLCNGGGHKYLEFPFKKLKVLEIGCGNGNDAVQMINNGAYYTGIDLTDAAVFVTKSRIGNQGTVKLMNAEFMDFPDNYFDVVYSWGAIHHTINPSNVMREIKRVLKPNGMLLVMLYNKWSFRYLVEIMFLRKILWYTGFYRYNDLKKLCPKPTHEQWLSWNTDNLGCPMSRVYDDCSAKELLAGFNILCTTLYEKKWFRVIMAENEKAFV